MTAEWIDGIRFSETQEILKSGYSIKDLMTNIVRVFSDQIFRTGFIHCDPHPGNMIIRRNPKSPSDAQVVLLDHGLYIQCSSQFTHDNAIFWKSIFLGDQERMEEISQNWGMSDIQLLASATLQKAWVPGQSAHISEDPSRLLKSMHSVEIAKERLRNFLKNTELIPKELLFIGRNMNCVRASNRSLGSPVNRINIMAEIAVMNLGSDWTIWSNPLSLRTSQSSKNSFVDRVSNALSSRLRFLYFKLMLFTSSIAFTMTKAYQYCSLIVFGTKSDGYESITDALAIHQIEKRFGLKIDPRALSS
jgi:aarF domain-containing kinase